MGTGCGASRLSDPATLPMSPLIYQCRSSQALHFGVFMKTSLHGYINEIIGHWSLGAYSDSSPLYSGQEEGIKIPALQTHGWFSRQSATPTPTPALPRPEVLSKHPLVNITKDSSVTLFTQRLSELCTETKTLYYIYNIKPQYHMWLIFHGKCEINSGTTNAKCFNGW